MPKIQVVGGQDGKILYIGYDRKKASEVWLLGKDSRWWYETDEDTVIELTVEGKNDMEQFKVGDKTADEMFAELGYTLQDDESDGGQYVYKKGNYMIVIDVEDGEYYIENEVNSDTISITFKDYKAINKKLEEFGWL